jgi:2-oxoglutarate ferredoxin oxidoreductase subunit beta
MTATTPVTMSSVPGTKVFGKTPLISDDLFQFCPGCTHGITLRIIAEVLEEMEIGGRTVGMTGDGCMAWAPQYMQHDITLVLHGRAPAVATGIKRVQPDKLVYTIQGDGDLASIGLGEALHAAARGENITVICVNNETMGMTHGQSSPTTLPGQRTTTSPTGKDVDNFEGHPMHIAEMIAAQGGAGYVARGSLHSARWILKSKRFLKRAFETQLAGGGFSFVELLSTCPSTWKMTPVQALDFVEDRVSKEYPIGELVGGSSAATTRAAAQGG